LTKKRFENINSRGRRKNEIQLESAPNLGVRPFDMNDDEFLAAFEACTLDEFHHRDHIKVTYLYLCRYSLDEAITKVRCWLQALALAWGAPVADLERGYHETMTQAWVRLVHRALSDCGAAESADAFCDQQPKLMQKTHLDSFYSRERLRTWQAKREFVEPDLRPFVSLRENAE
jgi:hypothetical protein